MVRHLIPAPTCLDQRRRRQSNTTHLTWSISREVAVKTIKDTTANLLNNYPFGCQIVAKHTHHNYYSEAFVTVEV